ncbi:DUF3099 domain-containing protein [Ornithinimicrobium sp. W1665]|uniref:DUF3099 domain-containing protein n=1 Tax=Ornithinimicrobium sp. W1665 TaxID=3416666 RepID=UPI003CE6CAC7
MTSARASVEADRSRRMRSYLVAMGIRTASFPLAVWAIVSEWYLVGSLLVAAAVVLPSVAVMVANAVDRRTSVTGPAPLSPVRGLGPAPAPGPVSGAADEPGSGDPATGAAAGRPSGVADRPTADDDGPIVGTVVSSRPLDDPEHREAS